ncbi:MAG: iron-containing alcohol dehydrogenase, partial [Gemmatimonadetes bacterium]|nr:iron-containing alcohol dehydrogenase [Gemmatimonadota bacterium]
MGATHRSRAHSSRLAPRLSSTIMGRGTIGNIPQILNEQQVKKAQIVTDRGLVQAGVVARVTEILDKSHIAYSIYDGVEPNPPIRNVEDCAAQYQSENCDFLLAIGGGSSMDVAKTSGVLVNHGGKITDYFIGEKPVPGPIP